MHLEPMLVSFFYEGGPIINVLLEGSIDNILVAVKHIRRRCHEMGAGKVEIHLNISSRTDPSSLEERKQKILGKGRQQGIFG